ncbi:MAG: DNA topoisomerase IV subunit A [Candidatus Sericytochromatia bacterium]|nr:DNA topoisomerase IV subunit A [Candidatus Sericytochromatia bacterium]
METTNQLKALMDSNFLGYASYVIKERAIPSIEDGLKPVQRRILHTLSEVDDGKFHKVANIVGHTMRYHPHGDASIEDALVHVAQKNYFIDQQGNFGNVITGDPSSAARYIECRLSPLARETLFNSEITEYVDSYDGRNREPVVLPCKLPSLLMAGGEGIAVGLSTKILPHNFVELIEAQIQILKGQGFEIFPDFPHGGMIDVSEYQRGKGRIKVRAKVDVTDAKTLTIREVPYGTTTESIIASIETAISKGKLKITSINDFTTERVEIELKIGHGALAQDILPRLFLYTDCETPITSNVVVIKESNPIETDVHQILIHNTNRLVYILEEELKVKLEKLTTKLHERILIKIFIENRLYSVIEKAENYDQLEELLGAAIQPYLSELVREVTDSDLEKLLSIPIKRISKFDMDKTLGEVKEINEDIVETKTNLNDITNFSIKYLKEILKKYGKNYPRKTEIQAFESVDVTKVAVQDMKVGYDKKTNYLGLEVKVAEPLLCSSFDKLLLFLKNGEYKIINIPDKLFLDEKLLDVDRQSILKTNTVIYLDTNTNIHYMKRFVINKFILDKSYRFIPEGTKLVYFTQKENPVVQIDYAFQKRAKVNVEYLHLGRLGIKSVSSIGNQVATKPILRINNASKEIIEMFDTEPEETMRLRPPAFDDQGAGLFDLPLPDDKED